MEKKEFLVNDDFKVIQFTSGKLNQNCFVVKSLKTAEIVLIDPGANPDSIIEIINSEKGILTYVLLTHAHYDHVGAVHEIVENYKLNYYIHKDDFKLLKRAALYSISMENRDIIFSDKYLYYEGKNLPWGDSTIEVFHVPGHTPGSVAIKIDQLLFSGDLILPKIKDATKLPGRNETLLEQSINQLLSNSDSSSLFFLGHGSPLKQTEIKHLLQMNTTL